jgi:hypothetical protein
MTDTSIRGWLVQERNRGSTPDVIAAELVAAGWDADAAARTSLRSLRAVDRQTLAYASLTVAAGIAALSTASAVHLGLDGNPDPTALTWAITVALIAAPVAWIVGRSTRRVERRSGFVLWSASRRGWFGALALCTGTVGVLRLVTYLFSAIATLTGASSESFDVVAAAQVLVSLSAAVPLFLWSLHEWRRSDLVMSRLGSDDDPRDAGPTTVGAP